MSRSSRFNIYCARSLSWIRTAILGATLFTALPISAPAQSFSWDNAVIYFVMTDRFSNGDTSNDHAYDRGLDSAGNVIHSDSPGRFFGGDLKGLTDRVVDGYFNDLGVNVIWITSPLEQVRGWVGGETGNFPAYAYHGYWPLDFTRIDRNVGTESDLKTLVTACHERGIRILMDVVLNHAGYNTLRDMSEQGFGSLGTGWQDWAPGPGEDWTAYHDLFIDYRDSTAWSAWWSGDWMRADITGYPRCGVTDETTCTSSLPDFRTESNTHVRVPEFLGRKWTREQPDGDDASAATDFTDTSRPVRQHLTAWLTNWVRVLGIDGFRLDTAKNLDSITIRHLKSKATEALREWKAGQPQEALDETGFWIVGEVFGHGVERTEYFDNGLDAVFNFDFQRDVERGAPIDSIYTSYSTLIGNDPTFNVVSFLSSHDTHLFDRERLYDAATALMLAPGNIQIFYGDETGRAPGPIENGTSERTRTPMNWAEIDSSLLSHWQRLGRFRSRHPSIAMGLHRVLAHDPYTFSRTYGKAGTRDQVVVVIGGEGRMHLNVSKMFEDNTILRDAYTGKATFVSYGMVAVDANDGGVILLEEVQ
jgi:alpha-amylase